MVEIVEDFNSKGNGNEYYNIKFYFNYRGVGIVKSFILIRDTKGETEKIIKSDNSKFKRS